MKSFRRGHRAERIAFKITNLEFQMQINSNFYMTETICFGICLLLGS